MADLQSFYVLDANVFIEAYKRYYAFDIVPAFWDNLALVAQDGLVLSLDKVYAEIDPKNQELKKWASDNFKKWKSTNQNDVVNGYARIMKWVNEQNFKEAAVDKFADSDNADAWVISYALAKKLTVVTEERLSPDSKKRVPIPNVCKAFDIRYVDTFQMLRELKIRIQSTEKTLPPRR